MLASLSSHSYDVYARAQLGSLAIKQIIMHLFLHKYRLKLKISTKRFCALIKLRIILLISN